MYEPDEIIERNGKAVAIFICRSCEKVVEVPVTQEGWEKRAAGGLIQDCFPELDKGQREMFVSGICPKCFDEMLGD